MSGTNNGKRVFSDRPAVRERVPILVGLGGPSGSGKTFSALRIAEGIKRVSGGNTFVVDTEARRSLHYADKFDFRFVQFDAPYSPDDYLSAVEHCIARGATQIVIDSMSHEHEGPGGVLEWQTAEQERLARAWFKDDWEKKLESAKMAAWAAPKQARRRFINYCLSQSVNLILCFRAKEKIKPAKGGKIDEMGWSVIGAEELAFEMTARFLLMPGSNGVPTLASAKPGEAEAIKIPDQFSAMIHGYKSKPLDEELGQKMAEWGAGDAEFVLTRGKHEGKKLRDVPDEYLSSLLNADGTSERMVRLVEGEIARRIREQTGGDEQQASLGVE